MIQKKKSPLPIILVIAAILIIAAVVCYFSFFSEAAIRDREIKAHIASAEKYLENLDYENAIAEYEEVLKLDPQAENILDTYVDTVLTYAEEVAESNSEKAADILSEASDFLDKISDGNNDIEKQAEELSDRADDYQAIAEAEKETEEEPLVDEDDSSVETSDKESSHKDTVEDSDEAKPTEEVAPTEEVKPTEEAKPVEEAPVDNTSAGVDIASQLASSGLPYVAGHEAEIISSIENYSGSKVTSFTVTVAGTEAKFTCENGMSFDYFYFAGMGYASVHLSGSEEGIVWVN